MRLSAVLGLVAVVAAWTSVPANAQPPISYPPSRALNDVAAWLQRETPLTTSQIVDVSPQAVTAVTSASPMGETRGFLANISSEAVDPQMLANDGIASWSIPVEVDCEKRIVRLGTMTGYHSRDLKTDSRIVREADTAWVVPTATAPLGSVIRALCDRDFRRPLMGRLKASAPALEPKQPKPAKPVIVAKADPAPPALRPALSPPATNPPSTPAEPAHCEIRTCETSTRETRTCATQAQARRAKRARPCRRRAPSLCRSAPRPACRTSRGSWPGSRPSSPARSAA